MDSPISRVPHDHAHHSSLLHRGSKAQPSIVILSPTPPPKFPNETETKVARLVKATQEDGEQVPCALAQDTPADERCLELQQMRER